MNSRAGPAERLRAGGLVVLLLTALSCTLLCRKAANEETRSKIEAALAMLAEGAREEIDLRDVVGFDFDKVYIFGPYTTGGDVESSLGFSWECSHGLGLATNDTHSAFVFTKGREVVQFAFCSARFRTFSSHLARGLQSEDATLRTYVRPDGIRMISHGEESRRRKR